MKTEPSIVARTLLKDDIEILPTIFDFPWLPRDKWIHYLQEQEQKIRTVCIVEKDHAPVGYGSLLRQSAYSNFREKGIPEISDIWILEEEQQKGLGTALIGHFEQMAKKEGYKTIGIGVGLYRDYGP
ncbi:MAG TPA: GNAT family N-acetyltransferase, partial [Chlamydiales bacterium]|nr:GNAT family N-acetyltransferase [Chlamydiales bacterium]